MLPHSKVLQKFLFFLSFNMIKSSIEFIKIPENLFIIIQWSTSSAWLTGFNSLANKRRSYK